MAATTVVWIVFAVLWAAVLIAAVVQLARAGAQAKRLRHRVKGYAKLPVVDAALNAQYDIARITAALDAVEPMMERAQIAIATIRRGPFPERVRVAYATARRNFADFNRFRG